MPTQGEERATSAELNHRVIGEWQWGFCALIKQAAQLTRKRGGYTLATMQKRLLKILSPNEMGVLEIPEDDRRPDTFSYRPMFGKPCKECGNAAVIKKDGCEFCTACGAIGACG
jgi:hypothetical protein